MCSWFQPTPLVTERRSPPPTTNVYQVRGFNPRPSLPRGEAVSDYYTEIARPGFNPRPSLPRGEALDISRKAA